MNSAQLLSSFATVAAIAGRGQVVEEECQKTLKAEIEALPDQTLPTSWVFWLDSATTDPRTAVSSSAYLKGLKKSAGLSTLKSVLAYALEAMERHGRVMLFKEGLKPTWEDRTNYNGGRFHLCCMDRQQTMVSFMVLLSETLGGATTSSEHQILPESELNGLVCSLKPGSLGVEVWNKTAKKKERVKTARKNLKKLYKRNILYYVHRTSVNINKFGIDTVLPVIEEKTREKTINKIAAKQLQQKKIVEEEEEKGHVVVVAPSAIDEKEQDRIRFLEEQQKNKENLVEQEIELSDEKKRQAAVATSCANEVAKTDSVMDALNAALLSAALTNAWNTRTPTA